MNRSAHALIRPHRLLPYLALVILTQSPVATTQQNESAKIDLARIDAMTNVRGMGSLFVPKGFELLSLARSGDRPARSGNGESRLTLYAYPKHADNEIFIAAIYTVVDGRFRIVDWQLNDADTGITFDNLPSGSYHAFGVLLHRKKPTESDATLDDIIQQLDPDGVSHAGVHATFPSPITLDAGVDVEQIVYTKRKIYNTSFTSELDENRVRNLQFLSFDGTPIAHSRVVYERKDTHRPYVGHTDANGRIHSNSTETLERIRIDVQAFANNSFRIYELWVDDASITKDGVVRVQDIPTGNTTFVPSFETTSGASPLPLVLSLRTRKRDFAVSIFVESPNMAITNLPHGEYYYATFPTDSDQFYDTWETRYIMTEGSPDSFTLEDNDKTNHKLRVGEYTKYFAQLVWSDGVPLGNGGWSVLLSPSSVPRHLHTRSARMQDDGSVQIRMAEWEMWQVEHLDGGEITITENGGRIPEFTLQLEELSQDENAPSIFAVDKGLRERKVQITYPWK